MRDRSGEYTLLKKIGRGGMGQVWTAVRRDLVMPCAIKVLHPELAETEKDQLRFFNEAKIAAQLDHGRIVNVIDTGEIHGCPFLVMDWVDGVNLHQLIEKARAAKIPRLDRDISLLIVGEVLAALQYAHNRTVGGHDAGVIHYDVTPGNILTSSSGEVKLTDFGIARFAATAGPLSRSVGTPRYMSPEQLTGHPLRETDIYSLGVVLHELLDAKRYLGQVPLDQFRKVGTPPELEPIRPIIDAGSAAQMGIPGRMDSPEPVVAEPERRRLSPVGYTGITSSAAGIGATIMGAILLAQGEKISSSTGALTVTVVDYRPPGWALIGVGLTATVVGHVMLGVDLGLPRRRRDHTSARITGVGFYGQATPAGLTIQGQF